MIEVVKTLTIDTQIEILTACRDIVGQAPLFQKVMPNGAKFRYLCTSAGDYGWMSDQKGYRYESQHPTTQKEFPPIPTIIEEISIYVVEDLGLSIIPQTALINWYELDSVLGLHQDKTEKSLAPVVSISIGNDCKFTIGGLKRTDKKRDIILHSGDVLVMGAEHRLVFHGVKKIIPETAPPELDLKQAGRINITVRQVYD